MDLLFNQEQKFYNSTLADLETTYHLDKNVPLNQITSQKIVHVKIQPLIALIKANQIFTKPLLG
jgi:hypothetical protein